MNEIKINLSEKIEKNKKNYNKDKLEMKISDRVGFCFKNGENFKKEI